MIMVGAVRLKYFPSNESISLTPAVNNGAMGWIHLSDLAIVEMPQDEECGTDTEEELLSNPP